MEKFHNQTWAWWKNYKHYVISDMIRNRQKSKKVRHAMSKSRGEMRKCRRMLPQQEREKTVVSERELTRGHRDGLLHPALENSTHKGAQLCLIGSNDREQLEVRWSSGKDRVSTFEKWQTIFQHYITQKNLTDVEFRTWKLRGWWTCGWWKENKE